jgi:hypothetical protein
MANEVASRDATKRNWIYVGLLLFIAAGAVIDAVVWPDGPPSPFTWNDVVQTIGIVALVYWWEVTDAKQLGRRQSAPARIATIFVPPLGHAIYLYQSRNWKHATLLLVLFWAGLVIVAIAAVLGVAVILDVVDPVVITPTAAGTQCGAGCASW